MPHLTTCCNHRPTAAKSMKHRWLKEQLGAANAVKQPTHTRSASLSHSGVRTGEFTNYLAMKKLKKAAFGYIASNLTQAEVGTLEEIFRSMDKNRDGYITLSEFDDVISQGNFSQQVLNGVRDLRRDLIVSSEEKLNWRDFLAMTLDRSLAVREDNIKKAFQHFKHTDADYLTVTDLAEVVGGEGHAQEIMTLLDSDGDGKVSFEDFRHALVDGMDDDDDDDSDAFHIH